MLMHQDASIIVSRTLQPSETNPEEIHSTTEESWIAVWVTLSRCFWFSSLILCRTSLFNWIDFYLIDVIRPRIPILLICVSSLGFEPTVRTAQPCFHLTLLPDHHLFPFVCHYTLSDELFRWLMSCFSIVRRLFGMTHSHWWQTYNSIQWAGRYYLKWSGCAGSYQLGFQSYALRCEVHCD